VGSPVPDRRSIEPGQSLGPQAKPATRNESLARAWARVLGRAPANRQPHDPARHAAARRFLSLAIAVDRGSLMRLRGDEQWYRCRREALVLWPMTMRSPSRALIDTRRDPASPCAITLRSPSGWRCRSAESVGLDTVSDRGGWHGRSRPDRVPRYGARRLRASLARPDRHGASRRARLGRLRVLG
jgi:hypothetical protein